MTNLVLTTINAYHCEIATRSEIDLIPNFLVAVDTLARASILPYTLAHYQSQEGRGKLRAKRLDAYGWYENKTCLQLWKIEEQGREGIEDCYCNIIFHILLLFREELTTKLNLSEYRKMQWWTTPDTDMTVDRL